ncbi:hypothetical protein [Solidesulfovibrio sp.]
MALSDPIPAVFVSTASFSVASDRAAEFVPGVRVLADCGADGTRMGTVTSDGLTTVALAMDSGAVLTANLVGVHHGNDVPASLCSHAANHAAGARDALTPAAIGAAAAGETKGLISVNTTIYVATTGDDVGGTGAVGAPFASISRALTSIAGKLIASGVVVTIQVADGTYTVSSTISVDHPDGDKIQILGNTSAETTVPIGSINTTAKTITVPGDCIGSIVVGDIIGLTGSSTSGLNGAYVVSAREYTGGNAVITCAGETFASSTVGGGSIVIKPCNRVAINTNSGVHGLRALKNLLTVNGLRFNSAGGSAYGVFATNLAKLLVGDNTIFKGYTAGILAQNAAFVNFGAVTIKSCILGIYASSGSYVKGILGKVVIVDGITQFALKAIGGSFIHFYEATTVLANCVATLSPAKDTVGNQNSYIASADI